MVRFTNVTIIIIIIIIKTANIYFKKLNSL